jgi:hypothetical protein
MEKNKIKMSFLGDSIFIDGRAWRFVQNCMDDQYQLWVSCYWCPDGDGIELYIGKDHFELSCFSGIGSSIVKISDLDFVYFQDKIPLLDFKEPFDMQCIRIADYFCRIFCTYESES